MILQLFLFVYKPKNKEQLNSTPQLITIVGGRNPDYDNAVSIVEQAQASLNESSAALTEIPQQIESTEDSDGDGILDMVDNPEYQNMQSTVSLKQQELDAAVATRDSTTETLADSETANPEYDVLIQQVNSLESTLASREQEL